MAHGFKIENEIVTTPEGVKIDASNVPHEAMGITKEVFLKKDYAVNFSSDAVLIDIGLNRSIASLYFATYPNIIKIYAFEPFKPTFELAKKNLELNPQLSKKINAFNFGLGRDNAINTSRLSQSRPMSFTSNSFLAGNTNRFLENTTIVWW